MDKDMKMDTLSSHLSEPLSAAAAALAENLLQSEPFVRYHQADRLLHEDQQAARLLAEFSKLQQDIRTRQYSEKITEEDIKRLRQLQTDVATNIVIQDQGLKQEMAVAFLKEVNQEISSLLGVDFASLTRRSGGCC